MYDEGEKTLKKETKFGVRATPFLIIKTIGYGFSFPYPVLISRYISFLFGLR